MSGICTHDHRTMIKPDPRDIEDAECVAEDTAKMERAGRAERPCALREIDA
jgi:hypothetical protein